LLGGSIFSCTSGVPLMSLRIASEVPNSRA